MNQLLGLTVLAGLFAFPVYASAFSLKECSRLSSLLNENFPQRVDEFATATGTVCIPGSRRPSLMYRMRLDLEKNEIDRKTLKSAKAEQLQGWCSEPRQLKLFRLVDIRYSYTDRSGRFVEEFHHTIESCPR